MTTPTIVIDEDRAWALLDEVVLEAGPDYVYRGQYGLCMYWDGAKPSCIVGRVLAKAGVDLSDLSEFLNTTVMDAPEFKTWLAEKGVLIEDRAFAILYRIQRRQDDGCPWARVVELAR